MGLEEALLANNDQERIEIFEDHISYWTRMSKGVKTVAITLSALMGAMVVDQVIRDNIALTQYAFCAFSIFTYGGSSIYRIIEEHLAGICDIRNELYEREQKRQDAVLSLRY